MAQRAEVREPKPVDVWERIRSLPDRFRPEAATGVTAEYLLQVGPEPFTVSVVDGGCYVRRGPSVSPQVRIRAEAETWLALDDGILTGADAFLAGRLGARGNLDLAVRLQTMFEPFARPMAPSDLQQRDVRVNGISLSSYVFGRGEPVYLLHGLGGTKVSWMPLLQSLGERYTVVAPDFPGHGESDKPKAEYSAAYYADVIRKLMDALGTGPGAMIGNSLGGRVALEMAVRYPKRVTALATLGAAVPGIRWRYLLGFTRIAPTEIAALPFPMRERWMQYSIRRLFARPDRLPEVAYQAGADEFIRVYRSARARVAFWASLQQIVLERPDEFFPRLRRIKAPALILHGDSDKLVPLRLGNRLADALPDADYRVLPDVGHVPQFEAPLTTRTAVLDFLEGVA
ncbi:MAG: alpha/beta fold hydrolase [Actinobacteria bacterium]|nr:alpha/beta fold hydrolase [Actinomycetota bacterium]